MAIELSTAQAQIILHQLIDLAEILGVAKTRASTRQRLEKSITTLEVKIHEETGRWPL